MTTTDELPYPSGWFYLARARELAPGSVLTRRFLDEDIVLSRTRGGRLRAVRPHCPHLGAHLGAGGTVRGENLVCPFHGFAFAPDGTCVGTPDGPPPRACLEQHTLSERNGLVLAWYDPEGAAPTWEVPDTAHAGVVPTAAWSTEVRTHPQEIIENTLDHRYLPVPHHVDVQEVDLPNAQGPLLHTRPRLGPDRPPAFRHRIRADRTFLMAGLGYLRVELPMPSLGLVSYLWAMHTPTGPRRTRMLVATACADLRRPEATGASLPRHGLHRAFARAMLKTAVGKVRQDLRNWNTKRYEPRPRLAVNDEGIGLFRHWARQFYPSS
ncbi:aromatic ring-hydroxylating dioxygenase subunit alpha [Streptomyces sp. NPDC058755]|uniref:aromatic ring-hydroxylating oxygenase subunit alpha n=1 Tax=unclassified Streptomyces TaxID=2593676 RepID=UPI0036CF9851